MMQATDLANRWNLHAVHGRREWRGPCPVCGYKGSLSLTEREGRTLIWCSSCQNRDALASLLRGTGSGFGMQHKQSDASASSRGNSKQAAAVRLWSNSTPRGLHQKYLAARGLSALEDTVALRSRVYCYHASGVHLPAMVAQVQNASGELLGVHRTYLRSDGSGKADLEPAKASLGPIWGGAIRIYPVAEELLIGEGIETSASAGLLLNLPAWAAISAGNLAKGMILPPEVRAVVIAADADPPGQSAAAEAAARWQAEGRHVRIATPNHQGQDFNDLLTEAKNG